MVANRISPPDLQMRVPLCEMDGRPSEALNLVFRLCCAKSYGYAAFIHTSKLASKTFAGALVSCAGRRGTNALRTLLARITSASTLSPRLPRRGLDISSVGGERCLQLIAQSRLPVAYDL